MNKDKLAKLQEQVRVGGKGVPRRKKKVLHKTATTDDRKLQNSLKKLPVSNIPGIEEVNMIKDDGTVIHFNNPKVQASLQSNTFAISGHAETKQITEILPSIFNQLGSESISHLKQLASSVHASVLADKDGSSARRSASTNTATGRVVADDEGGQDADDDDDDDVPDLVENFDEASKAEAAAVSCSQPTDNKQKHTPTTPAANKKDD